MMLVSGLLLPGSRAQDYKPPRPFGDPNLLTDFFCAEVVYPPQELEKGIEGTVVLSFVVEKDGAVTGLQARQKVSPAIDAEACRLFRMLLWEPAISLGQPVAAMHEFPFKFNIKKYKKQCKERGYDSLVYPFRPVDTSLAVYQLTQVDKAPQPIFSEPSMTLARYIQQHIRYPETAYRQSISGKVTLQFVIEPHGRVSNIRTLVPVGGGCTQEAIRLLQMIRWMPGIKQNQAVRTMTTLDIAFKLPEDSEMKMFENTQMNN